MSSGKRKAKPREDRGGRFAMMLELDSQDNGHLEELVKRYAEVTHASNKAFVLRQLIRNAAGVKKLPPVKLT